MKEIKNCYKHYCETEELGEWEKNSFSVSNWRIILQASEKGKICFWRYEDEIGCYKKLLSPRITKRIENDKDSISLRHSH